MTTLIVVGLVFTVLVLGFIRMKQTEKQRFDERSDITKIVRAADRRRRDASTALRFMREK